jgi:hypothetical protein
VNRVLFLAAAVLASGGLASSAEAGPGPPAALIRAVQQTGAAKSMNVALSERVSVGTQATTIRLSGVQHLQTRTGSFVLTISPTQPGLAHAEEIVQGPNVYIHYGLLDTLHAKNPNVKNWILVDMNSSLGVDPSTLAPLGVPELREMTGVKAVGSGTDGGVRVTRYKGSLSLREAAQSPEVQQLLAHLPSAEAAVTGGSEQVEYTAGEDGYIHAISSSLTLPFQGGVSLHLAVEASFADFDHANAHILPPPAAQVMTLARFDQLAGVAPAADDAALLETVVLKPSQVGAGYTLSQIPGGQLVQGETTLDFCGLSYPSESLRSARLQVIYDAKGSEFSASNEVVTYQPGGARKALQEVTRAAAACPNGRVKDPPRGVTDMVRHTHLISDRRLLSGAVAIVETETGTVNGKRVTVQSVDVYQVRGDVLSGVYGSGTEAATVRALTLHAAEESAENLKQHVAAATKTPATKTPAKKKKPVPSALTA